MSRIEDATKERTVQAIEEGAGFTAWDVAQLVEKQLPEDYPHPPHESRIMAIHRCASTYLTDLLKDTPGAIEWVSFSDFQSTPECPSWCHFHRPDCEGCHFGRIVVNDIEIEVQLEPGWDEPRVDVDGISWVNGPDLTDLAEALHIAERTLSAEGQVSACLSQRRRPRQSASGSRLSTSQTPALPMKRAGWVSRRFRASAG